MRLIEIRLESFRSYASARLCPSPRVTILHGENGAGKTNLLEAIHFLSTARGFRSGRDGEMIRWDAPFCLVEGQVERSDGCRTISIRFEPGSKKLAAIDGASVPRVAEAIGCLHVVDFSSRDLSIIRGEPSRRRDFMDVELVQQSSSYGMDLARYKRSLAHRNALLGEMAAGSTSADLSVWDEQLARFGEPIVRARQEWLEAIAPIASETHSRLSGDGESLSCRYRPDIPPGGLLEALASSRSQDLARGTTSRGPHRDDIEILVSGRSARQFASQGQQRTAALALKVAQAQVAERRMGEAPVLLLDDVLSDLDEARRNRLLEYCLSGAQMIMTCTDTHQLAASVLANAKLVQVSNSRLVEEN
ncbi:MAG: DNA replication and repair protein RecF [Fimbriimonadales bacterium]